MFHAWKNKNNTVFVSIINAWLGTDVDFLTNAPEYFFGLEIENAIKIFERL